MNKEQDRVTRRLTAYLIFIIFTASVVAGVGWWTSIWILAAAWRWIL